MVALLAISSSDAAHQLEHMATLPLEGSVAPHLEDVDHLQVDSPHNDSFHQFREDPLVPDPLNVGAPSPNADSKNFKVMTSIAGSKIPEDVISLEVTSVRSNNELLITSVCKGSSSTSQSTRGTNFSFFLVDSF